MKIEKGKKGRKRKEGEDKERIVQRSTSNICQTDSRLSITSARLTFRAHVIYRAASAVEYYLNRRNHIISLRASPWIPNVRGIIIF